MSPSLRAFLLAICCLGGAFSGLQDSKFQAPGNQRNDDIVDVNRISGKENNQFRLHDVRFEVVSGLQKKYSRDQKYIQQIQKGKSKPAG